MILTLMSHAKSGFNKAYRRVLRQGHTVLGNIRCAGMNRAQPTNPLALRCMTESNVFGRSRPTIHHLHIGTDIGTQPCQDTRRHLCLQRLCRLSSVHSLVYCTAGRLLLAQDILAIQPQGFPAPARKSWVVASTAATAPSTLAAR